MGIKSDGELTNVARPRITVQNLVQSLRRLGRIGLGSDHFALAELQPNIIEGRSEVDGGSVVLNDAFDAVLDRTRKHFAVRDVAIAATGTGPDAFDRKT